MSKNGIQGKFQILILKHDKLGSAMFFLPVTSYNLFNQNTVSVTNTDHRHCQKIGKYKTEK